MQDLVADTRAVRCCSELRGFNEQLEERIRATRSSAPCGPAEVPAVERRQPSCSPHHALARIRVVRGCTPRPGRPCCGSSTWRASLGPRARSRGSALVVADPLPDAPGGRTAAELACVTRLSSRDPFALPNHAHRQRRSRTMKHHSDLLRPFPVANHAPRAVALVAALLALSASANAGFDNPPVASTGGNSRVGYEVDCNNQFLGATAVTSVQL